MCSYHGEKTWIRTNGPFHGQKYPIRIKACPECGRKLKLRIITCGCPFPDSCYLFHSFPKHKVKGWFKKKKVNRKERANRLPNRR